MQMEAAGHENARKMTNVTDELSDVRAKLAALEAQHGAAQQASSESNTQQASAIAALQEQLDDVSAKLADADAATSALQQALADVSAQLAAMTAESAALRLEDEELKSTLHAREDELQLQAAQADSWESKCLGEAHQSVHKYSGCHQCHQCSVPYGLGTSLGSC